MDAAAMKALDALDAGQLEKAHNAFKKPLAQNPKHILLRAAEALWYLKSQRRADAVRCARELSAEASLADRAFGVVTHIFQTTQEWQPLHILYQSALKTFPVGTSNHAAVLQNLFSTSVRMLDFVSAQKYATMMGQQGVKWATVAAAMANVCQVPREDPSHFLLRVAAAVLRRLHDDGTADVAAVVVDVLLRQRKFEEALAVCRGGRWSSRRGKFEAILAYARATGDQALHTAVARFLWVAHPDHWEYFMPIAEGAGKGERVEEMTWDVDGEAIVLRPVASIDEALSVAAELQAAHPTLRGPHLAELELRWVAGREDSLRAAAIQYAQKFGTNKCCFLDLQKYWTPAAQQEWCTKYAAVEGSGVPYNTRVVLRHQLSLLAETTPSTASEIIRMLEAYDASASLSEHLEWSEQGYCDEYLLIVLNHALRAMRADPSNASSWSAVALVAFSRCARMDSNPLLLTASALLHWKIGAVDLNAHKLLDVKSVQVLSLARVAMWPLMRGFNADVLRRYLAASREAVHRHDRDGSSLLVRAFETNNWPKVQELLAWHHTLRTSLAKREILVYDAVARLGEFQTRRHLMEFVGNGLLSVCHVEGTQVTNDESVEAALVYAKYLSPTMHALLEPLRGDPPQEERIACVRTAQKMLAVLVAIVGTETPPPKETAAGADCWENAATAIAAVVRTKGGEGVDESVEAVKKCVADVHRTTLPMILHIRLPPIMAICSIAERSLPKGRWVDAVRGILHKCDDLLKEWLLEGRNGEIKWMRFVSNEGKDVLAMRPQALGELKQRLIDQLEEGKRRVDDMLRDCAVMMKVS